MMFLRVKERENKQTCHGFDTKKQQIPLIVREMVLLKLFVAMGTRCAFDLHGRATP